MRAVLGNSSIFETLERETALYEFTVFCGVQVNTYDSHKLNKTHAENNSVSLVGVIRHRIMLVRIMLLVF